MGEIERVPEWLDDAVVGRGRRVGVGIELHQANVLWTGIARGFVSLGIVSLTGEVAEKLGWTRSGGTET